jgi:hypothetical protein
MHGPIVIDTFNARLFSHNILQVLQTTYPPRNPTAPQVAHPAVIDISSDSGSVGEDEDEYDEEYE